MKEQPIKLAEFIHRHRDAIIGRWCEKIVARLGLQVDRRPQLVNDMPELLDDLVESLQQPPEAWSSSSARAHAVQRIQLGVDIGGLSEEVATVGEVIIELAAELECEIQLADIASLLRLLGRGAAQSVTEYARLRDAQLAQQAARDFSFIAHELRTPLQSAMLSAQLLPPGPLTDRVSRAHQQLLDLVDNRLIDARLTSEPDVQKTPTRGREMIDTALANADALARERGIDLESSCDDQLEVEVDRRLIESALTNLVVNGVKFSREGGRVEVTARAQEDRVHFEVRDSCGGLPEDALPALFQPFTQVGRDRSGFGLGLMIVKQAVEANGGAVRVANRTGQGCNFILDLPRRRSRLSRES